MIQFNLLPDVKLQYIKAQKMRRLILSIAVIVSLISLVSLGLLGGANQLGKKHLADLSRDITRDSKKLQNEPQINKILTVQNQLESLSALHAAKPAVPRLFDYLNRLTPAQLSITNFTTDFTLQTATITGTADALSSVNQYIDTLKYTKFVIKNSTAAETPAFSTIVLSSFGLSSGKSDQAAQPGQAASFSISFKYDPLIFDITKDIDLKIPALETTRQNVVQPSELFTAPPSVIAPTTTTKPTGSTR